MILWWLSVRIRTCVFLTLSIALLSGCSLSTPVPQSSVQTPQQWNTEADALVWPEARWWSEYQQPQLSGLIAQANVNIRWVTIAVLMHLYLGVILYQLGQGKSRHGPWFYRTLGWVPFVLIIAIAGLTGAKPDTAGELPPPPVRAGR